MSGEASVSFVDTLEMPISLAYASFLPEAHLRLTQYATAGIKIAAAAIAQMAITMVLLLTVTIVFYSDSSEVKVAGRVSSRVSVPHMSSSSSSSR